MSSAYVRKNEIQEGTVIGMGICRSDKNSAGVPSSSTPTLARLLYLQLFALHKQNFITYFVKKAKLIFPC